MGHGIVQVAAQGGMQVVAVEADAAALERGLARIEKSLEKLASKEVEKGKLTAEQARAQSSQVRGRIRGSLRHEDLPVPGGRAG